MKLLFLFGRRERGLEVRTGEKANETTDKKRGYFCGVTPDEGNQVHVTLLFIFQSARGVGGVG